MFALITAGGCSTTYLQKMLFDIIENKDVHERHPQGKYKKVLYVYDDPRLQLLSFYRRGFLQYPYDHARNVAGDHFGFGQLQSWNLEDYLKVGVDRFMLMDHFLRWEGEEADVYMIAQEDIVSEKEKLAEWMGDKRILDYVNKPRSSSLSDVDPLHLMMLNTMFGPYMEYLARRKVDQ